MASPGEFRTMGYAGIGGALLFGCTLMFAVSAAAGPWLGILSALLLSGVFLGAAIFGAARVRALAAEGKVKFE